MTDHPDGIARPPSSLAALIAQWLYRHDGHCEMTRPSCDCADAALFRQCKAALEALSAAPPSAEIAARADAVKLLDQLVAPCDGAPTEHGWRKCKRCTAVHGVEMRFGLSMRLLKAAADQLALPVSRPTWRDIATEFQREREILHSIIEDCNALICPEEHAGLRARIEAILVPCDEAGKCVAPSQDTLDNPCGHPNCCCPKCCAYCKEAAAAADPPATAPKGEGHE